MALSANSIFKAIYGLFSGVDSTDETTLKKLLWRKQVALNVTDGGTAGTAAGETLVWYNDTGVDVAVRSALAISGISVTANATNYATFDLSKRDGAGGSATSIATFATDTVTTDDMVAFVPKTMTLTDSAVVVPSGGVLTAKVTKAGTGVAIGSATVQARIVATIEPVI